MTKRKIIDVPMKYGDNGVNVEEAQELLQKAGSTIKVTGIFSIGMVSAVKSFQKKNGLEKTGIIDILTWEKLIEKASPKKTSKKR